MWNSQLFSYFLNLLKDKLKLYSFENLEKKSHTHYEFNIYRVNNEFNLYLIYIYEMNKEISKQVKRLLAETPHVRAAASEVMKAYGIKLTKGEFGEITEKLGDRIKDDEKEQMKELVR